MRHRLASYTGKVCEGFSIPTRAVRYGRAKFDPEKSRWVSGEYELPINPYNEKPIFLVPKRYIRPLPTINPGDYWDYCFDNEAESIRETFGEDITSNVNKEAIIKLAREHPETRERYIAHREDRGSEPYDFISDPRGVIRWYRETYDWTENHPLALNFVNSDQFQDFMDTLIAEFRNFVENNRGWSLLWNENETPKREEASQLLFLGIVKHYCKSNNVDISKEANIGRGPVDFKVSSGYEYRALIEVKLAKNTRFWRGLKKQLPKYLQAEDVQEGRFLIIVYTENDLARISDIQQRTNDLNARIPYSIISETIDAQRDPPSASVL